METSIHSTVRASLIGSIALVAFGVTDGSAFAASGPMQYSCTYVLPGVEGSGSATATFDTGIEEGLTVDVGDEVSLNPVTGSVTLPAEFVDALRVAEIAQIGGGGDLLIMVNETESSAFGGLTFAPTPVPAEGPIALQITGDSQPVEATAPGTNTITLVNFGLVDDSSGDVEENLLAVFCDLVDEGDVAVDSFEAVASAVVTPTVTTPAATTPRRPVVVQTDFAGQQSDSMLPLLAGTGLALVSVGAAGQPRRGSPGGARRH
jgi:hypothetical protein